MKTNVREIQNLKGVIISLFMITLWCVSTFFLFHWDFKYKQIGLYIAILIQMHLYTGLFITAHDAMHQSISKHPWVNLVIGQIATFLYAGFYYQKLKSKHHLHHQYVHSEKDPDYHTGSFLKWYLSFMLRYITWYQLLLMALIFNLLKIFFPIENLMLFFVIPSLLSTLQLFYFGTWLPHHGEHENIHQSNTLKKNHFVAFITCYFFGYHYEHHEQPYLPWWQLYKTK